MKYAPLTLFNGCPDFFQSFNNSLVQNDKGRTFANSQGLSIKQSGMGLHYLDGIQGAASKWRLAQGVVGLKYSDEADVSDGLKSSYSAQARVTVSVIAFEAFVRMFQGKTWPEISKKILRHEDDELHQQTWKLLSEAGTLEHLREVSEASQKKRIQDFMDGKKDLLYAICVSLRNAFAHGRIGGKKELADLAPKLQNFILDGVQLYCTQSTLEVTCQ